MDGAPHSLLLAAVAGPLRVAAPAADGAADVGVRLLGAVDRAHRAEGQVELAVLEGGRPAVPAARAALLMAVVGHRITNQSWLLDAMHGCFILPSNMNVLGLLLQLLEAEVRYFNELRG